MTFNELNSKIQKQFKEMQKHQLFKLDAVGEDLWNAYLSGFEEGEDPIFRDPESSTHTCRNDRAFITRYGNIVAIDDELNIMSMFDIEVEYPYVNAISAVKNKISSSRIVDVFVETQSNLQGLPYEKLSYDQKEYQLGMSHTLKKYTEIEAEKFGVVNNIDVYRFDHFHVFLDSKFVWKGKNSADTLIAGYRSNKDVFKRGITEIPLDILYLVRDLITQGSLLNGDAQLEKVIKFIQLKEAFESVSESSREAWIWKASYGNSIARFRNELIGTLCVELAESDDLNKACSNWNKRVDPQNYMKAVAPITKRQIQEAEKFVEQNGYIESFNRRFATLSDINVSEIKHMNVDGKEVKRVGLFSGVHAQTSSKHAHNTFENVEQISIDKFMQDILPTVTSIEALVESRLENNLVSLITSGTEDSKKIFKWNNNYSWTYNGNLTGKSQIRQAVKTAGGDISGVLRFSLIWNEDGEDIVDLDAHAYIQLAEESCHIHYGNKREWVTGGALDVDMINPRGMGVENITWPSIRALKKGTYEFKVENFNDFRNKGFKAEVEANGVLHTFEYDRMVSRSTPVTVAIVHFDGKDTFTLSSELPASAATENLWGLPSGEFHKVNLVCLSPNHWGEDNVGNKHYFFMLDGCKSDIPLRSFHNEYLKGDLLQHRKVMEVLASTTRLEPAEQQLSGLGFNSTVSDYIIVKLNGSHNRVVKINF